MILSSVHILLLAAVIPGLFLAWRINRLDQVEHEPFGLLVELFFLGALAIIPALILERVGSPILSGIFPEYSLIYQILMYFVVVACSEELSKYVLLKRSTWNHPAFNYRFDAVIYAVCVGVGFAVFENITYVMSYGLITALVRAVTAVPAHTIFAIFMGHYYGKAKYLDSTGDRSGAAIYRIQACVVPILLHGFYDFTASSGNGVLAAAFWVFLILLYIIATRQIRKDAREDMPLY